jgi:hypothetical protein
MADSGMAVVAMTQSFAQFTTYMPRLSEVRRADPSDPGIAGDVRVGALASLVGSLTVGIMVSTLSGSKLPVYISLVSSLVLITMYEMILRSRGAMEVC